MKASRSFHVTGFLALAVAAGCGVEPELILGPSLSVPGNESVYVWWHTSVETGHHRVEYGNSRALGSTVELAETTRYPQLHITGLSADTTYFYRVRSDDLESETYAFRTPPVDGRVKLLLFADNQAGVDVFRGYTVPLIEAENPHALVSAGDLVMDGNDPDQWARHLYEPARQILSSIPWFPVRGNHDGESPLAHQMLQLPNGNQWYAMTYGPFRIVALDTNVPYTGHAPQQRWLEAELQSEAWRQATFRIVSLHKPPFTALWNRPDYDGEAGGRSTLVPLFESRGADLVLSGHTHGYEHGIRPRSDGGIVHYVISGGAGGRLDALPVFPWPHIEVSLSRHNILIAETTDGGLEVRAVDPLNREVLDRFTISRRDEH